LANPALPQVPNNPPTSWLINKRDLYLSEYRTPPTCNDIAETSLLQLIQDSGLPISMYPKIMQWAQRSQAAGYSFLVQFRSPPILLDHLSTLLDMSGFTAIPKPVIFLPDNKASTAWTFDAKEMIYSLLTDSTLMVEENMDFPDPHDPFVGPSRTTSSTMMTSLKHGM
jgi:hypothetical protein